MFRKWTGDVAHTWDRSVTFEAVLQMYSNMTPYFHTEYHNNARQRNRYAKKLQWMRRYANKYPRFGEMLLHEGFGVAPKEWPPIIAQAFPTDTRIPSPYECACAMLKGPTQKFWSYRKHHGAEKEALSAFMWYLMGAHPIALATLLHMTEEQLYEAMSHAVTRLLGAGKFVIWALSTDLRPVLVNKKRAEVLAALYRGESLRKWTGETQNLFLVYDEIVNTPYVKAQLATRKAFVPIERPIYHPGLVFPTIEGKRAWEAEDTMHTRWLMKHRVILGQEMAKKGKHLSDWVDLPMPVPVYDRWAPEVIREKKRRKAERKRFAANARGEVFDASRYEIPPGTFPA